MSLEDELPHFDICIKRWRDKLVESVQDKNYDEAAFYARALGNEYYRLSVLLHEEYERLNKTPG